MRSPCIAFVSSLLCACGAAGYQGPIGSSLNTPLDPPKPEAVPSKPSVPDDVVERAAQPFHAKREADGQELDQRQFFDELARFDVICLGEAHDSPRDHYAELLITQSLADRARFSGRALGVGFEMFQEPYSSILQLYGAGRMNDAALRKRTQFDQRWGFPYAYYQPILAFGRSRGLPLKALNAPRELTHAVAGKGLAGLTPKERRQLPELDLDNSAHRAAFDRMMADHPRSDGMSMDNFYAAQVVWDETMANNAADWLADRAPSRQLLVLAGSAHCRKDAVPARIARREPFRITNVRLSGANASDSEGFAYTVTFDGG
ncbi:MAG: ChaN family lipoprotein [Pseudomonadota bacterium]